MAGKKKQDETKTRLQKLAVSEPLLTALSDHALLPDQYDQDSFNLIYRLGPVFDILRHPDTETPMAITITGDWGTGKTSGMRWLEGLINDWNNDGESDKKVTIKPIWFYPWKYHTREDVWRGIIARVVISSIQVKGATTKTIRKALKQFGLFLGKSYIHILGSIEPEYTFFESLKVKLGYNPVRKIINEYEEINHPEKNYLNHFESTLEEWIKDTLRPNERMVIFIDDLDRCMPDVALEVLEALKLYLNIKNLIFVVGVDKIVIRKLVKSYYEKHGVLDDKSNGDSKEKNKDYSNDYLAKMFQVEVELSPPETQIGQFLEQQLEKMKYWREHLSDEERSLFAGMILKLADRNPRQVKRLVNNAMMAAAGFLVGTDSEDDGLSLRFKQGMQIYFIKTILTDRHGRGTLVGSKTGDAFFIAWSEICKKVSRNERNISVPKEFIEAQKNSTAMPGTESDIADILEAPDVYRKLLREDRFLDLLPLLADKELGDLMQVPYPTETADIRAAFGSQEEWPIILEAAARSLEKKPDELTDRDYADLRNLNLSGADLADVSLVRRFINLQSLLLYNTQVSDIEALKSLTNLQVLDLRETQVSDIKALKSLTNLQTLILSNTQVSDIEALKSLVNLQVLDLYNNTKISDIKVIESLINLQTLDLSYTQVSDIEALKSLTNLQTLDLLNTQVSDIEALKSLTNLEVLNLRGTQVSDIEALKSLINLKKLNLSNAQVSDIKVLESLINLQELYLGGTQVSAKQIGELKRALPKLKIRK